MYYHMVVWILCFQYSDQCANMTTNSAVLPLTAAVLSTAISSVIISTLVTAVMCYCIMKNKRKGVREDGKHVTPEAEPMYETPLESETAMLT